MHTHFEDGCEKMHFQHEEKVTGWTYMRLSKLTQHTFCSRVMFPLTFSPTRMHTAFNEAIFQLSSFLDKSRSACEQFKEPKVVLVRTLGHSRWQGNSNFEWESYREILPSMRYNRQTEATFKPKKLISSYLINSRISWASRHQRIANLFFTRGI